MTLSTPRRFLITWLIYMTGLLALWLVYGGSSTDCGFSILGCVHTFGLLALLWLSLFPLIALLFFFVALRDDLKNNRIEKKSKDLLKKSTRLFLAVLLTLAISLIVTLLSSKAGEAYVLYIPLILIASFFLASIVTVIFYAVQMVRLKKASNRN